MGSHFHARPGRGRKGSRNVRCFPYPCLEGRLCAVKACQVMHSAAVHLSESRTLLFGMTPEAPLSQQNTPLLAAAKATRGQQLRICKRTGLELVQLHGRHLHVLWRPSSSLWPACAGACLICP